MWLGAEVVDIEAYRERLLGGYGADAFKAAVIEDLTRRRDVHCRRFAERGVARRLRARARRTRTTTEPG